MATFSKMVICTYILDNIFDKDKSNLQEELDIILDNNISAVGWDRWQNMYTQYITVYQNTEYKVTNLCKNSEITHDHFLTLLNDFKEEFNYLHNKKIRLDKDIRNFTYYIRTILNECENVRDTYVLFNEKFHHHLPDLCAENHTLSDEEIIRIKKKIKPMEHILEERILRKLIQG